MKVRITYTIDLEEVPKRVQSMLSEVSDKMQNEVKSLSFLSEKMVDLRYLNQNVSLIDDIRQNLAEIDQSLADSQSIIQGLAQAHAPAPPQQEDGEKAAPDV
jgi:phosphate uptake regulator